MSKSIKNNRRPIYISTENITNLKYILEYSPKGGMLSNLYNRINNRSKELKTSSRYNPRSWKSDTEFKEMQDKTKELRKWKLKSFIKRSI